MTYNIHIFIPSGVLITINTFKNFVLFICIKKFFLFIGPFFTFPILKLNYLIVGDKPTKRKIDTAKQLKVKILNQKEWLSMLDNTS